MTDNLALLARRQMLERGYAAFSRGNLQVFSLIFDLNVVVIDPTRGNPVGRIAALGPHQLLLRAFPGLTVELEELIDNRARSVCRLRLTGTHSDYYRTWEPTGRRVRMEVCEVHEWCEELVVTTQRYWDELTLLNQIGIVVPVPLAVTEVQ
jgi:predicted ester cyclase